MNMESYSKIFKNIRRIDLLLVLPFFLSLCFNAYQFALDRSGVDITAFTDGVIFWLYFSFGSIFVLEIISFFIMFYMTKSEFNLNFRKALKYYFSDIFMMSYYKSDKKSKPIMWVVRISVIASILVLILGFVYILFVDMEADQQQEINYAKLEVVEQFREINDKRLNE